MRYKLIIKKVMACVLFSILIMSFTSCGFVMDMNIDIEEETYADEKLIVVGFSQVGSESLWRTANTESMQNALSKENGYFMIFNNARQKQENQIKAIRQFISQRVDYIVFSPVTEFGWDNVLEEARGAGIPVILVDRTVDVENRDLYMTWIGSDMYEEGRKAGRWVETYTRRHFKEDEPVNIVVLRGTEDASSTIGRTEGFHEIANNHDNWNILEEPSAEYTTAKGQEVMLELLKKYKKIDILISQNDDMTFGAIAAMDRYRRSYGVGGDVAIVSFDATREALEMVADGKINVDIECNPLQGNYVEHTIWQKEHGFTILKSTKVDEMVFTKDNVRRYLEERQY